MVDSRTRSLIKSIVWRIAGIVLLIPLGYAFTGKWTEASAIAMTFHAIRVVMYYFHERAWERVRWGR